jgi:glycerol dehydrogenase
MREFTSPGRYLQGAGILSQAKDILAAYAKPIVLSEGIAYDVAGKQLVTDLAADYVDINKDFDAHLLEAAASADLVVGVGGGRVIDKAKQLAEAWQTALVIVPTAASTDAAITRLIVTETNNHDFAIRGTNHNPDLVMVDSNVIVNAPVTTLVAGMGDAIATSVEGAANRRINQNYFGAQTTVTGRLITEAAENIIFEFGEAAISANQDHQVNLAFENVVEANILLSGIGAENSNEAIAHIFYNATLAKQRAMHGAVVAYGSLVQLVFDHRSDDLPKYRAFYEKVGLPLHLSDLGMSADDLPEIISEMVTYGLNDEDSALVLEAFEIVEGAS